MRVGICTIHDPTNYGNRLQRFAVQSVLERLGHSATEIVPVRSVWQRRLRDSRAGIALRRSAALHGAATRRYLESLKFSKVTGRTRYVDDKAIEVLASEFDYFVVGSDQVWNPNLPMGARTDGFQCLTFARSEQKVALSPSFGVGELDAVWRDRFRTWLQDFSGLSVRERQGQDIIRELTGREATLLVDPTMALDAQTWRGLARRPEWTKGQQYVLVYRLGAPKHAQDRRVAEVARESRVEVVRLLDPSDARASRVGPQEFLALIDGAECVFTDSFHACAFCLMLHTPFVVWRRDGAHAEGMWSRIEGLETMFNLDAGVLGEDSDSIPAFDWGRTDAILHEERQSFHAFVNRHIRPTAKEQY